MLKNLQSLLGYFDKKSLKYIHYFFILSNIICIFALILFYIHMKYYISISLYKSGLIIFRTGLFIGICPCLFTVIINKWKKEQ